MKTFLILLFLISLLASQNLAQVCTAPECLIYDISSQSKCQEVSKPPHLNSQWKAGLGFFVDQALLKGKIIAYKIRWFNGSWSGWFVPGINDIDHKFNTVNKTMRRMWSYFFDHSHLYIICQDI